MLFDFGVAKRVRSGWTALLIAGGLGIGCVDETVAPASPPGDDTRGELHVLGFAELTFSDIGTPDVSSSLIVAPTMEALEQLRAERDRSGEFPELIAQDFTLPDNSGGGGNGTIQLGQRQTNRFEHNGVRYLSTRINIRNAQADGTAYDTPRNNLTFLAVSTNSAINQTAVSQLRLEDGTPAPPEVALQVMPTVRVELDGDSLIVPVPDVLQIMRGFELTDIAANAPPGVTTVFPYGFVVRRAGDNTTRTLPASPGANQFDGVVDFAFSIPLQDSPADDPEKLSVFLLAVDDSETRLTQGLQQQNPAAQAALQERATSLNADTVTLLPGGSLPGVSGARTICRVRTAGAASSPTAYLVDVTRSAFQSFTPDPHATGGSASHISSTISFEATFNAPVQGAAPDNFTVRGIQSGPKFIGQDYTISGTTISTPSGNFFAGEQVEIALTNALACPDPQVAQYYVQSGQATGEFQSDSAYEVGSRAVAVAIGDVNGDGSADLVTANEQSDNVSVVLNQNDGTGTFHAHQTYAVGSGSTPQSVAIGDLNGDGSLDLVTANLASSNVSVLLNQDDGTFQPAQSYGVGVAISIAIGDLDGDGSLDLVTANLASSDVSVLLNHGDGTFRPQQTYGVGSGSTPEAVAIGDVNEDGSLDLVVANGESGDVTVLLNNGTGTFQAQQIYAAGDFPNSVAIGDLNGDGSLDLAVGNGASGNVSILLNHGDGTGVFQTQQTHDAGDFPNSIATGDVNGDGSLDLVIANDNVGNASVLLNQNDGTGTFEPQQTYAAGAGNSVAIGDLNGNGILDLAMANDVAPSATVSVIFGQAVP